MVVDLINTSSQLHKGHQLATGKVAKAAEHDTKFLIQDVDVLEIFSTYEELSHQSNLLTR